MSHLRRTRTAQLQALVFLGLLACVMAAFEAAARWRIGQAGGENVLGPEVYAALRHAREPGPAVERVYVGDSVARQFFPGGAEPSDRVRFLTSNAAISLAGDFYMAQDAFAACPRARDIVLLCRPEVLTAVDLEWPIVADYFSAFFHTPAQVAEIWRVRHDPAFTLKHAIRWALPGILAINQSWRQPPVGLSAEQSMVTAVPAPAAGAPGLMRDLGADAADRTTRLSPLAAHFLARLRALAGSRGGSVRVILVPLAEDEPWTDTSHVLTGPITYIPRESLADGIHIGSPGRGVHMCLGTDVARRFAAIHGLTEDLPVNRNDPNGHCEDAAQPISLRTTAGF